MAGRLHYLNADFDLGLRRRPRRLEEGSLRKIVQAMTLHGLLLGGDGDAVLTKAGVPGDFVEYLERQGIELPRIVRHPRIDRAMHFSPFGWSAEAIAINEDQLAPAAHPDPQILRRVNSREFSAGLESARFGGEDAGKCFTSVGALAEWLGTQEGSAAGWVVKADHGNAGVGNRRLRTKTLSSPDRQFIDSLLEEDDRVVVEPWRRRVLDLCAVFSLDARGEAGGFRLHETLYTRDGALIGAVFVPGGHPRRDALECAAGVVAGELTRAGYFGPVCFDAFVCEVDGKERLRPLADLNCRRPMSDAIHRWWREKAADRVLLWRFFNTRKLKPEAVEATEGAEDHYSPGARRGVLLSSPWSVEIDGRFVRAPKLAAAFIGESRSEVERMEGAFRARCER
jgi:hypothetical protein